MCRQALIVTQQLAETDQFDSYVTRALLHVRPALTFGRSAKAEPAARIEDCVWYWWQDFPHATLEHTLALISQLCLAFLVKKLQ